MWRRHIRRTMKVLWISVCPLAGEREPGIAFSHMINLDAICSPTTSSARRVLVLTLRRSDSSVLSWRVRSLNWYAARQHAPPRSLLGPTTDIPRVCLCPSPRLDVAGTPRTGSTVDRILIKAL